MKGKLKYFILVLIMIIMLFIMAGCGKEEEKIIRRNSTNSTNTADSNNKTSNNTTNNQNEKVDYKKAAENQMSLPKQGDKIAVFHVKNFGDITVKFFEKSAPKAVENFITHAENGYYNGTKLHRVIEEFMIQGGDPKGNGTGGESIWGGSFGEEIDNELVPYRGALCMASTGYGTNGIGSQFFIVQANYSDSMAKQLLQYKQYYGYTDELLEQYKTYGGYLSLYKQYTVFGQVIDGMDVVDKITKVEKTYSSSGELSVPVEDIIVESIEVKTY